MNDTRLVLEGHIDLAETEGGFAPADIEIGCKNIGVEIAKWLGVQGSGSRPYALYDEYVSVNFRVRLTLEVAKKGD